MTGDTVYDRLKRVAVFSNRIRAFEPQKLEEAAAVVDGLLTTSASFSNELWEALRKYAGIFREAVAAGAISEEAFPQKRDSLAEAVDTTVGITVLNEQTRCMKAMYAATANFDIERMQEYVPKIKEIGDLLPANFAETYPQEFEVSMLLIKISNVMSKAMPALLPQAQPNEILQTLKLMEETFREIENSETARETIGLTFQALITFTRLRIETDESKKAILKTRLKILEDKMDPNLPLTNVRLASGTVNQASKILADGGKSLNIMNLVEAMNSMDHAQSLLDVARTQLDSGNKDNTQAESVNNQIKGLHAYVFALRAYAATLRACIMGELNQKHVDDLKDSDALLYNTRDSLKNALLSVHVPLEKVNIVMDGMDGQRVLNRNLWRLAQTALSPRHVSRAATSMFLVFFVASFIIITITLRLSGTIETLGPSTIGFLIVASFAASLIAAFGFQALKFLPFLNLLAGWLRPPGKSVIKE